MPSMQPLHRPDPCQHATTITATTADQSPSKRRLHYRSQAERAQLLVAGMNAPYSPLASSFEMGPLIVQAGRARTRTLRPGPFWFATEAGCFLQTQSTAQQQGRAVCDALLSCLGSEGLDDHGA